MSNRLRVGILMVTGLICLTAMAAYAADGEFAGKWKGETKVAPPPARGIAAAPGSAAPEAGAPPTGAPPAAAPGGGGGGRGGGGRR